MGLHDYRQWLDIGARDGAAGAIELEVEDEKLRVEVVPADGVSVAVRLDVYDLGVLTDLLREAAAVLLGHAGDPVALAAVTGLRAARDTPGMAGA